MAAFLVPSWLAYPSTALLCLIDQLVEVATIEMQPTREPYDRQPPLPSKIAHGPYRDSKVCRGVFERQETVSLIERSGLAIRSLRLRLLRIAQLQCGRARSVPGRDAWRVRCLPADTARPIGGLHLLPTW
jgi:hypothetical protein